MNTLALCRRFFETHGYPLLKDAFPELVTQVAAGRVGGGSDVLGADDEHSRKGEWGPSFQIFMGEGDYNTIGPQVWDLMNSSVPPVYEGYVTAAGGGPKIDVFSIEGFMRERMGLSRYPETQLEWLALREDAVCNFVRGDVFYDPSNVLTQMRTKFAAYYPSDVWKLHLARAAYTCWFYGPANYPDRIAPRGDIITGLVARGMFVEYAMRLTLLLNRQYAPSRKWLHWAFTHLPMTADELDPLLIRITTSQDMNEQASLIVEAASVLSRAVQDAGFKPAVAPQTYLGAFDIVRTMEDTDMARQPIKPF